jgi:hypothetical protein
VGVNAALLFGEFNTRALSKEEPVQDTDR